MIHFEGPLSKVLKTSLGGSPTLINGEPLIQDWYDFAKGQDGSSSTTDMATGTVRLSIPVEDMNRASLIPAIYADGFTMEGAPLFVKMSAGTYAGTVPVGVRKRLDEDDNPITWSAWKDAYHVHYDATDGSKIVFGNSVDGNEFASSEISALLADGNYTFYMAADLTDHIDTSD